MPFSVRYNFWLILGYIVTIAAVLFALIWSNRMRRREKRRRNYAQARLLIQSRLVEQRNEFNEVLSSLPDGIVTFDTNLKVHLMNHSFLRMLGKDNNGEGINYQNMDTSSIFHIHLNGEDITYALLKKACDEQRVIPIPDNTFLEVVATKNYFPISGEILPTYSHKRLTGVMLSCRNISTDELNKRFFRLAVEASAIYPCSYDINTQLFSYSKSVYGRLGIDANTPLSLDFIRSIIHPDDVERMTQGFRDVCSGVRSDYRDEMRVNVLGTYEWMSFFCIAYKGFTAETPYRVLSVAQSIQQYKEVQEELIAARDKALETDKLKSAFLANMSHEIRTPLNAIVGFSDLLRVIDAFTADEVREFIETINVNCSLLLSLINDILDLARIEAGSMEFRIEHQRLSPVLHDIYDSQRYSMPHDVELILDVPDNDAEVSIDTDAVRLKQVLNNLINNAKKFTSKGSITFGYQYYDDHTMFYVEDTGIGMSEEEQHRVFERFYKVNTFTQGAGLGLSICLTIIDFFNGSIDVTSKPNVGTRFTIIVPNKQLTK
jgi:signal transduction histidine kinase